MSVVYLVESTVAWTAVQKVADSVEWTAASSGRPMAAPMAACWAAEKVENSAESLVAHSAEQLVVHWVPMTVVCLAGL